MKPEPMNPETLRGYLVKLQRRLGTAPALCRVETFTKSVTDPSGVRKFLRAFAPKQGWLCFQSRIERFLPGEDLPDHGILLYGEVVSLADQSLHIRQNGGGGWILTRFVEQALDEREATHLVEEITFLGETLERFGPPKDLRYRRYWGHDPDFGYRPLLARFAGFTE